MKTFAIGDIHGAYKALVECLDKSAFDKNGDRLVILGDVVDGWSYSAEVVEELLSINDVIPIAGNHDIWFKKFLDYGDTPNLWMNQGGRATFRSYENKPDLQIKHKKFYFDKMIPFYIQDNKAFVHGGYDWSKPIKDNCIEYITWDRHMYETALMWENTRKRRPNDKGLKFVEFDKIFIGHTTTEYPISSSHTPTDKPVFASNLINLDTGAGWSGKLTIMDIDTLEYWQSSKVEELYPEETNARR